MTRIFPATVIGRSTGSRSITNSVLSTSAAEEPNKKRDHDGNDRASGERKVEKAALGFQVNVSRQASETEFGKPWPQQSGEQDRRPDNDQNPLHGRHPTAGFLASGTYP